MNDDGKYRLIIEPLAPEKLYVDGEGGQLGDRGTAEGNQILAVDREKGEFCLVLKTMEGIEEGKVINIDIDKERRFEIAQQHTAQHLLSAILERELDVKTVGFQMGENFSTIDITLDLFTEYQKTLIENTVNTEIKAMHVVNIDFYSPEEFKKLNLRMRDELKDKIFSQDKIRVVSIGEIDKNPCGGLHVKNTLEIGLFKIVKTEKVKGNLTRLYFVAGVRAIRLFQTEHEIIEKLIKELTCGIEEIPERVKTLLNNFKALKSISRKYTERLAKIIAKNLLSLRRTVLFYEDELEIVNAIPGLIEKESYVFVGKAGRNRLILAARGFDLKVLYTHLKKRFEIQGGCGPTKGQIVYKGNPGEIVEEVERWVERERSHET
ncbi:hypothetical protein IX53_03335 [Kosmotoga pacifica]|uniref:Alanyl-transfer RNA synthetases family profile domain-containing protein n=1 Tax=Kosmotoga pacifica TaxID=1330330 RepID=A0A0G2Z9J1_9BACT|nr:hypothetical protein IX53_03335 [Kosmotoga pacifica]